MKFPILGPKSHSNFKPGERCPICGLEAVLGENGERQCYECGFAWNTDHEGGEDNG